MIIYNTSFHVEEKHEAAFLSWLKTTYVPTGLEAGLANPMLARLVNCVEPGCCTYALHLEASDMEAVGRWECSGRNKLLQDMASRWGYGVLAFSTPMEKVEL